MKKIISFLTIGTFVVTSMITSVYAQSDDRIKELKGQLLEKRQELQDNINVKKEEMRTNLREEVQSNKEKINGQKSDIKDQISQKREELKDKINEQKQNQKVEKDAVSQEMKDKFKAILDALKEKQKEINEQIMNLQEKFRNDMRDRQKESVVKRVYEFKEDKKDDVHEGVRNSVYKSVYKSVYAAKNAEELKILQDKLKLIRSSFSDQCKSIRQEIRKLRKDKNDDRIMMFVNGAEVEADVPPVVKDGRTLVPVNSLASSLGATVKWDPATKIVSVTKTVYNNETGTTNLEITIKIDSMVMKVNGAEVKLDVPAQIHNNRTVIPLRALAKALMKNIEWETETNSVVIDD